MNIVEYINIKKCISLVHLHRIVDFVTTADFDILPTETILYAIINKYTAL